MKVHAHRMFVVLSPTIGLFAHDWVADQVELEASYQSPVLSSRTATLTDATDVSSVTVPASRTGRPGTVAPLPG